MAPHSPLPPKHGVDAARLRTPDRVGRGEAQWKTMGQWLRGRLPPRVPVEAMAAEGAFVYADGTPLKADDLFMYRTWIWFHRELPEEPEVPGKLHIVHQDERIVVVDKPPFLATTPRGRNVRQSVLVRLRGLLGIPELAPAHRLDRVTSGLLILTTEVRWRRAYQLLFERGEVSKTYWALAHLDPDLIFPKNVSSHISKQRGRLQAQTVSGLPDNAETMVELESSLEGYGVYKLRPRTGKTHQLRVHMNSLGIPILNDPLYPNVLDDDPVDFSRPLQLLAGEISFTDPVDGTHRQWQSVRRLPVI